MGLTRERLQYGQWDAHARHCESVLERVFLQAYLRHLGRDSTDFTRTIAVALTVDGCERTAAGLLESASGIERVDAVVLQPELGRYRADFLVWRAFADESGPIESQRLVVECDGHDFHCQTKAQGERDRVRDRYLTAMGFAVFRFHGSELWANPARAAVQVDELLRDSAYEAARDRHGLVG